MRIDAQQNHDRILAAYRTLVAEEGLHVGMRDIAAAAGVTEVTIYRHFSDRDALRRAVQLDVLEQFGERIKVAVAERRSIEDTLAVIVRFVCEALPVYQAVFAGPDVFERQLARRWVLLIRPLVNLVRAGQDAGELRADVPAPLLVNSMLWSMLATLARPPRTNGSDHAVAMLSLFLDGARPRSVPSSVG